MNYYEYLYSLGYMPYPINYMNRYGYSNIQSEKSEKKLNLDSTRCEKKENRNTSEKLTYNNDTMQSRIEESDFNMALDIIKNSVGDEADDEAFYDFIISISPNEEQQEIIRSIRDDERKHNRLLRNLYTEFTGVTLPMSTIAPKKSFNMNYTEALEKALFGEVAAVSKYQKVLKEMKNMKQHNTILEILTDELRHANKYNYLITKNS